MKNIKNNSMIKNSFSQIFPQKEKIKVTEDSNKEQEKDK